MRILFVMRHPQYVRNYESTLEALAKRGHTIHLAFTPLGADTGPPALAQQLAARHPGIRFSDVPGRVDVWTELVKQTRSLRDRLRYQHEDFRHCADLARRASVKAEALTRWLSWLAPARMPPRVWRGLDALLRRIEAAIPPAPSVSKAIRRIRPDVVLATPLVDLGSQQRDYVKAARALGIPSGLCVASWDNLTNKGLMQTLPDRVFVWNEHQRSEAVRYHEVTAEQVVVTGAQCYDQWFDRQPSTSLDDFCGKVGLPSAEPFVAYLGSSKFIAPREARFVRRWIESLRASGDLRLQTAPIVVRPHPGNAQDWSPVDELRDPRVVIWPRAGQQVHDDEARANYFDTFYHAAAAVGVNTSAMVEAGIAGCVCHTIRDPEFSGTQDGTLHFAHLLRGGYVRAASDLDEHGRQLAETLGNPQSARESLERFCSDFLRPHGRDVAGTPRLVAGIERMREEVRLGKERAMLNTQVARAALLPLAFVLIALRWLLTPTKRRKQERPAKAPPLSYRGWHWPRAKAEKNRAASQRRGGTGFGSHTRQLARYVENAIWQPQKVEHWMRRAAASDSPIVLGPWLSEVGFELLYWVPMMRHYLRAFDIAPSRVIAISRGGVASWYRGLADRYVEIFDLMPPEEFHNRNLVREKEARGKKQNVVAPMEQAVVELALKRLGEKRHCLLHPLLMYGLFRGFWRGRFPQSFALGHCDFSPLPADDALPCDLPFAGPYFTAKFYYSSCFPDTPANAALVDRVIGALAERHPVVLLSAGLRVDDHDDWSGSGRRNVFHAQHWLTPQNNLAVQSALVARSRGLFSTYGGFSYLAPLLGRPVTSTYSDRNFVPGHLQLAEAVFNRPGDGLFAAVPAETISRWLDELTPSASMWATAAERAA